jgi:hypothetical protein
MHEWRVALGRLWGWACAVPHNFALLSFYICDIGDCTMATLRMIDICNMALGLIGHEPIETLDEPSEPPRLCRLFYDPQRRALLRSAPWGFATCSFPADALPVAPFGWPAAYALPEACLHVVAVCTASGQAQPFAIQQCQGHACVAAGHGIAYVRGIADTTDVQLFDALFTEAFAAALAVKLCMPLTNNKTLYQLMVSLAEGSFARARVHAANESQPATTGVPSALVARLGHSGGYVHE